MLSALQGPRATGALALVALSLVSFLGLGAAGESGATETAENRYIGAAKCKGCHSSPESGDQHGVWSKAMHAGAFKALASEEAKKLGAEKGIADPQKDDACVKCHVTAFGEPAEKIKKGFDPTLGVQCETCHGPGEAHMKARFAAAAKGDPGAGRVEVPAGEIIAAPTEETCRKCHNEESPSYKPFCFHEFEAKIRHVDPRKQRADLNPGPCSCPKCAEGCPDSCKDLFAKK